MPAGENLADNLYPFWNELLWQAYAARQLRKPRV